MKDERKPKGQMTAYEKFKWMLRTGRWGVWTATNNELDAATSIDLSSSERASDKTRQGGDNKYVGLWWWLRFCIVALIFFDFDEYKF